jgi:hypothetical protein
VSSYTLVKRHWELYALFLCDALIAHALPRLSDLPQNILGSQVASAEHAGTNGKVRAIALRP